MYDGRGACVCVVKVDILAAFVVLADIIQPHLNTSAG